MSTFSHTFPKIPFSLHFLLGNKFACSNFLLYLCRKFGRVMKVKWTSIIDDMQGSVDKKHYARHIHVPHTPSIIRAIALPDKAKPLGTSNLPSGFVVSPLVLLMLGKLHGENLPNYKAHSRLIQSSFKLHMILTILLKLSGNV